MLKKIESAENPLIKKLLSLKQKKYRDREGLYFTEGLRICRDILTDKKRANLVEKIFISEDYEDLLNQEPFSSNMGKTVIISDKISKLISDTVTNQGILLLLKKNDKVLEDEIQNYSRILLLDRISDPGNAGTILRTALAAKFDAVLSLKGSSDFYNPKTVRASMGAINKIDTYEGLDQEDLLPLLREEGFLILAGDLQGQRNIYDNFDEKKIALILGSEAHGLGLEEKYFDFKVTIPMHAEAESLNAAVAAGLLMYALNKNKF